jgi:hypothetical protein
MSGSDIPRRAPPSFRQRHGILAWIPRTNERSRGAAHGAMSCSRRRAASTSPAAHHPGSSSAAPTRSATVPSSAWSWRGASDHRTSPIDRSEKIIFNERSPVADEWPRLPRPVNRCRVDAAIGRLSTTTRGPPQRIHRFCSARRGGDAVRWRARARRGAPTQSPPTSARQAITHGSTLHDDDSAARADRR